MATWQGWGAGIGLQGRNFPALDIDVDDANLADVIQQQAFLLLGPAPVRFGRGPRRLLVYSGIGMRKQRLAFRRTGEPNAPVQAVEFLADGQQYVVEGIHPKTERPYRWLDSRSPVEVGLQALTPISLDTLKPLYLWLAEHLGQYGYEVVGPAAITKSAPANRSLWQGVLTAPSVAAIGSALAAVPNDVDYDTWLKVGAAVKASAGPENEPEAFALWEDWSLQYGSNTHDVVQAKWNSLRPPFRVGWEFLSDFATDHGDGSFVVACEEFDAVADAPPARDTRKSPPVPRSVQAMFARYIWVERLKRACDLQTGELLDREQFNVRNSHIGPPTSNKDCAWAQLISTPNRLKAVKAVTYRPGGELFVTESLPGLVGPCVNRWRAPALALPDIATDDDVRKWLDHVAVVIPDARERGVVLDWLAWVVQHPGEKPNWALVIGSTAEGIGKDLMLDPIRTALGPANVREIGPGDLASANSDYLENTRLLIVEEMDMAERKAMMNRLKTLLATPPYTLRVNIKFQPQFEIPNLLAVIFFTNMENALALSRQGRRYFVTWNDGQPQPASYYTDLVAWYRSGGHAAAARWLLSRDVSGFSPKGNAPETVAREDMRRAALPRRDELIEDGLQCLEGPFAHRYFTLEEVNDYLAEQLDERRLSNNWIGRALSRAGCQRLERLALGDAPPGHVDHRRRPQRESNVFCRCDDAPTEHATNDQIKATYWLDRRYDVA